MPSQPFYSPYDTYTGLCYKKCKDNTAANNTSSSPTVTHIASQVVYTSGEHDWRIRADGDTLKIENHDGNSWITEVTVADDDTKFCGDILPCETEMFDVGNATKKWKNGTFSGQVKADSFFAHSDRRLKKDIDKIPNATNICSKLTGVTFKWRKNNKRSAGLIAQQVLRAVPELVSRDETGIMSVDYMGMVGVLVQAVNELSEKVHELERKVQDNDCLRECSESSRVVGPYLPGSMVRTPAYLSRARRRQQLHARRPRVPRRLFHIRRVSLRKRKQPGLPPKKKKLWIRRPSVGLVGAAKVLFQLSL